MRVCVPRITIASTRQSRAKRLKLNTATWGAATPFGIKIAGKLHSRL